MPGPGPDTVRALTCLIQDSELVFGEKLGSGSFGVVKKAEWHTPTGQVVGFLVPAKKFYIKTLMYLLSFTYLALALASNKSS